MNARVKKRKLQAKTAIMIMAPKKAKALLWVVATKPLPVRLRSSVGVRRDGRASRILFFWWRALRSAWGQLLCFPSRACVAQRLAWVKTADLLCFPAAYSLGELFARGPGCVKTSLNWPPRHRCGRFRAFLAARPSLRLLVSYRPLAHFAQPESS